MTAPPSAAEAFIAAVKRGDLPGVEDALAATPSLAATRDAAGVSIVCLAVYHNCEAVAHQLVQHRTDLDIFEASTVGDALRVQTLLQAEPTLLNAFSPDGFQPLGLACFFGRRAVFDVLLARGAVIDAPARNVMQVRPLHSAVAHRDEDVALDLAMRLLAAGAAPNVVQQGGFTPLHEAALRGHAALVAVLLDNGADPAMQTHDGQTAVHLARKGGHQAVVALLNG